MLSIKYIRENPTKVRKACKNKGVDEEVVNSTLEAYKNKKRKKRKLDDWRAKRNKLTGNKKPSDSVVKKIRKIKKEIKEIKPDYKKARKDYKNLLAQIPNIPAGDVPIGKDESENKVIKKWGDVLKPSFKAKDHLRIGQELNLIDVKRAAKVSGSRFGYLKHDVVLLEFALIDYVLKKLIREGFTPLLPPAMTKVSVFKKLGYFQGGGNKEHYLVVDPNKENKQEEADYYLIGTAEHSVVPMHKDETIGAKDLPKRYIAFSPAFRREAGSWGKDTRGIFRVHQFDKLEMVSFCEPQVRDDKKEQRYLLGLAEKFVQDLGISYRVVKMCTGDLGHPTARKYDIECWFPSENRYRETHSISTTTSFQSRALKIRYAKKEKKGYLHVLNGTACAVGRMILSILENYQQKDGSVKVPNVLQKYVGKKIIRLQK